MRNRESNETPLVVIDEWTVVVLGSADLSENDAARIRMRTRRALMRTARRTSRRIAPAASVRVDQ